MSPACVPVAPVVIVTLVPALREVWMVLRSATALSPTGVNTFGAPPPNAPFEVAAFAIVTLRGSSSHSPARPAGAAASTAPNACR